MRLLNTAVAALLLSLGAATPSSAALIGRTVTVTVPNVLSLSFKITFDPTVSVNGSGDGGVISDLQLAYPTTDYGAFGYMYDADHKILVAGGAGSAPLLGFPGPNDFYFTFKNFDATATFDTSQWMIFDAVSGALPGSVFSSVVVAVDGFTPGSTGPTGPTPGVPEPGSAMLALVALAGLARCSRSVRSTR